MKIKLIVGLANPGLAYMATRHNIGSWYIYLLAQYLQSTLRKDPKFSGNTSYVSLNEMNVHLLVPTTFMNLNGDVVSAIARFYKINPNEILVAYDELDLPPGVAKFKFGGSHCGHNGLKDIINKLGNESNFYRLRIGIGRPENKNEIVSFLLSKPSVNEKKLINEIIDEAVFCTKIWFDYGPIKAINRLHSIKLNS